MAVNLGCTSCLFCGSEVLLDEEARRVTPREAALLPRHLHRARVADATCSECEAQYVAWFQTDGLNGPPGLSSEFFRDLSHRSTMSDVPDEVDLPMFVIDRVCVRRTWPTCLACGKRVYGSYGCQCDEPQPLRVVVRPLLVVPEWRNSEFAATTYDLFVPPPVEAAGDDGEWASLRGLIEISYLVSLSEEVQAILQDLREHYIEVALPPAGDRAYQGDDRRYHEFIEGIVNRASLVVESESLMTELTPETPIDGGAGLWLDPKNTYVLQALRKTEHWLAAFSWAYSKLPHHWIHIMQEQVNAYRGQRSDGQESHVTTERWWVSLEENKLARPIAYFERNLPLGLQIGGLYIADGAAFVAEDKRKPRAIASHDAEEMIDDEAPPQPPPVPKFDDVPPATISQYPNLPMPSALAGDSLVQQYPNTTRSP